MKKLCAGLASIALSFMLTGCGDDDDKTCSLDTTSLAGVCTEYTASKCDGIVTMEKSCSITAATYLGKCSNVTVSGTLKIGETTVTKETRYYHSGATVSYTAATAKTHCEAAKGTWQAK